MAKGKAIREIPGTPGMVAHAQAGEWDFIYEVSSIKNPKHEIGDKVETPDGRVFRYCKSGALCDTFKANMFYNAIPATGIDWSVLTQAQVVGDKSIIMTNQGTAALTKDQLRGGYINISINANETAQSRLITGNTAGGVSDEITIYFDAGLIQAVTTSWYAYCMPSPYSDVRETDALENGKVSMVGYAAAPVSTSGLYHWEQTAGQISASLYGSEVGKTAYHRDVIFRYDGNLEHRTAGAGDIGQRAGYIMDNNSADNGATVIMLQLDT